MELIEREVPLEEFHEVAFIEYRLFGKPVEEEDSDVRISISFIFTNK